MRNYLIYLLLFISTSIFGQEQLGLRLENYAGINGITLNPTSNLSNPLRIDINIASVGFFVDNNYLFVRNTNTIDLLRNAPDRDFFSASDFDELSPQPTDYIVDYFDDGRKRFGSVLTTVMGPSVAFKIGDRHSVGVFTAARQFFSTQDIPNEFSFYKFEQVPFFQEFRVDEFTAAFMTWSEIGLNYAYQMPTTSGYWGIGANLKFLQGYDAAFFRNERATGFSRSNDAITTLSTPQVGYGFTTNNLDYNNINLQRNGIGLGVDLGVTYVIDDGGDGYIWKLGASILDLGFINFNQNTERHQATLNTAANIDENAFNNLDEGQEVEQAAQIFSEQVLGDVNASLVGNSFRAILPGALSLQADYSFMEHVYVNATLVQRLPINGIIAKRNNILAFTPRFEHRWFSASLPLILYNWQDFRVGLAARLGFIILGTDNLGSWVGNSDYTGTDFYAGVKVNFSELNFGGNGFGGSKRKRGPKVKCYF